MRRRSVEAERARQTRNGVRAPSLRAGQLAFFIAGAVADARAKFESLGPMITNLGNVMGLGVVRNAGTAPLHEKVQNAAWSHLDRERGNVDTTRDDLTKPDRKRLSQRIHVQ